MSRRTPRTFTHEFVEFIPSDLKEGVIYVSIQYATAVHNCACGCGSKVVTPITPTDWELTFDGETISLYPSIGNWNFPCRSHYWIRRNRVKWAGRWSQEEIEAGRAKDRSLKQRFFEAKQRSANEGSPSPSDSGVAKPAGQSRSPLKKLRRRRD
jgi:uncharacterized protein DUF6527